MGKHQFLSRRWIEEARAIRDEYVGDIPTPPAIRMNLTVSGVPFSTEELAAHVDTTNGLLDLDEGHLEDSDVVVTSDYGTVRMLFVEQNPEAVMAAFLAGKIRVQGDLAKLLALQTAFPSDDGLNEKASEVADRIRAITAD